jgi:hypothetical protein
LQLFANSHRFRLWSLHTLDHCRNSMISQFHEVSNLIFGGFWAFGNTVCRAVSGQDVGDATRWSVPKVARAGTRYAIAAMASSFTKKFTAFSVKIQQYNSTCFHFTEFFLVTL